MASKANIDYLGPKNGTPPRVVVVGDGAVGAPAASVGEGKRKLGEVRDNLQRHIFLFGFKWHNQL